MTMHERDRPDRLNELLDALSTSRPAWRGCHAPDEWDFATTALQVRALDDAPTADPRFAQQLLQTLLADSVPEDPAMIVVTQIHPPLPARPGGPHPTPWVVPPTAWAGPSAWVRAMLVLLLAAASLMLVRLDRPGEQHGAPVILPAVSGTPETNLPAPPPGTPLLYLVIPESSADRAFVSLERYTLPPAAVMTMDLRVGGNTPLVAYLVAGDVQARLGDVSPAARVARAGGTGIETALVTGESATLAAGDALVVPEQGMATVTNESSRPAEVLLLFQPTGIPAVLSTAGDFATLGTQVHPVSAPLTLDLRQTTLAPGSAIARSENPQVVQITGALDPDRVMDVRTASGGALRNAGEDPLAVYVLTVTSDGPPA